MAKCVTVTLISISCILATEEELWESSHFDVLKVIPVILLRS